MARNLIRIPTKVIICESTDEILKTGDMALLHLQNIKDWGLDRILIIINCRCSRPLVYPYLESLFDSNYTFFQGVPLPAFRAKVLAEGLDPDLLE